jgi:hypothetical protein
MTYTILSAQYANEDHSAAVIQTEEAGGVLVSEADTPDLWAAMMAWGAPSSFNPSPGPADITFKSDIFDRCANDTEAQTILDGVAAKGVKMKAFFDAVVEIRHDHPLFAELKVGFVQAFGQERADALLAPSD